MLNLLVLTKGFGNERRKPQGMAHMRVRGHPKPVHVWLRQGGKTFRGLATNFMKTGEPIKMVDGMGALLTCLIMLGFNLLETIISSLLRVS